MPMTVASLTVKAWICHKARRGKGGLTVVEQPLTLPESALYLGINNNKQDQGDQGQSPGFFF